jgi:hypothetical protein
MVSAKLPFLLGPLSMQVCVAMLLPAWQAWTGGNYLITYLPTYLPTYFHGLPIWAQPTHR